MVPWHCMVHYRMCNWTGWHYKSNSQRKMPTSIQSHDIYRLFNQSIVHYVCHYVMWSANAFRFRITCKYIFIFRKSILFYCILLWYSLHFIFLISFYFDLTNVLTQFKLVFWFLFDVPQLVNSLGFQAIVFTLSYIFMLLFENPFIRLGKLLQGKWFSRMYDRLSFTFPLNLI